MLFLSGLLAFILALVHLFAGYLRFLRGIPRSRWLSLAGGASVSYVFLHLLPELRSGQITLEESTVPVLGYLEHHVYLLALLGLVVFYGLERAAKLSRAPSDETPSAGVFWLHMASFFVYNLLIGYLLVHREEPGLESLLFYFAAMALHFIVNDFGLREHHEDRYHRHGRWMLAGAVMSGWAVGILTEVSEPVLAVLISFLGGGIILNVLKEELPEERKSRFWAFVLGSAGYALLLMAA